MNSAVLLGALLALVVVLRGLRRSHRELQAWLGRDRFLGRRNLRALALGSACALLAAAFQLAASEPPQLAGDGIDVVLLLDVSRSMGASDVAPSRLRRAVRTAERLVLETDSARLGLVLFAGDAFAALPLTQDRDAVLTYLRATDTKMISQRGSDLSRGLTVALRVFDPRSDRPRRVVLLSDGEHRGRSLEEAAAQLRANGVRVTSIGFGDAHGGLVPGAGGRPLKDEYGDDVYSRRVDASLELLSTVTGGGFFVEHRDRPSSAALLPPPSSQELVAEPPAVGPLRAMLLAGFVLIVAELLCSLPAWRRGLRAPVVAALATLTLGVQGASWLEDGDRALAKGDARTALSHYRRTERSYGAVPESRLRIGNALYRLGDHDRAAAAYLDALRALPLEKREQRFAANFNLGDALLSKEHYAEARDAFWTAILDRPDSLEAKFNYEWALQRAGPEEPPPDLPTPLTREPDAPAGEGEGQSLTTETTPTRGEGRTDAQLSPDEAQRWLDSLEERVEAPLRRQIAEALDSEGARARGGQAW